MKYLFDELSLKMSRATTRHYSTSFSLGTRMVHKSIREDIHAIYGMVRFADEIVDSFHEYDKVGLLDRFERDTFSAIDERISLNPILNAFQQTVNKYSIDPALIHTFFSSMRMDLTRSEYSQTDYEEYVLGSAEVVGLMCLKVFCLGDEDMYENLKPYAMKLGAAFQKVNFLRDIKNDRENLGRIYFPQWQDGNFSDAAKREIEMEIANDFREARVGIRQLPQTSKFGVYSAYVYYKALFLRIKRCRAQHLLESRVRIPNVIKILLLGFARFNIQLNRI